MFNPTGGFFGVKFGEITKLDWDALACVAFFKGAMNLADKLPSGKLT